jgi:hypothetical protein
MANQIYFKEQKNLRYDVWYIAKKLIAKQWLKLGGDM